MPLVVDFSCEMISSFFGTTRNDEIVFHWALQLQVTNEYKNVSCANTGFFAGHAVGFFEKKCAVESEQYVFFFKNTAVWYFGLDDDITVNLCLPIDHGQPC